MNTPFTGKGTRVLVTGGLGYIGSEAARTLRDDGVHVHVLDDLSEGHRGAWDGAFTPIDLQERRALLEALENTQWDAVMHFAARCYVGESVSQPVRYWRANLTPVMHLLEALPHVPFIFSSTCASFGHPQAPRIDELHPQVPVNPYGATKLAAERLLKDRAHAGEGPYGILRYFNAAGGTPHFGEDHRPETHLIPLAIQAALGKAPPLTLFGTDWDTKDGTCVRDYIHVSDLAQAHIQALHWLLRGKGSNEWNVGTGEGASVLEVIQAVEEVLGMPVPYEKGPRRAGDPALLVASPEKVKRELNWKPAYPTILSIVRSAVEWHQRFPDGYPD